MEELLMRLTQDYGFSGLLLAALVYVVYKFEGYLVLRDARDDEFRKELMSISRQNTEAFIRFTTIFEAQKKND